MSPRCGRLVEFWSAVEYSRYYPFLSALLCARSLVTVYWPAGDGIDVAGYPVGRDFINVWSAPQLALGGRLSTLFDLEAYHSQIGVLFGRPLPFHNWSYPLFTLLWFWPLAQLPYFAALAVWTLGLFAAFAGVTLSEVARPRRIYAAIALALAPASLINAISGQNGFLTATLLLGGILSLDRRPMLAGLLLGCLACKPHLGLVLPFALVALRAWRTIASAAATALLLILASAAVFGIEPWRQYIAVSGAFQLGQLQHFDGFYTRMMASVFAGARSMGIAYSAAMTIQVAVAVPVLATTCWAIRKTPDPCRRACLLGAAAPLLTPYALDYDLTPLAAVTAWVLTGRLPLRPPWRPVLLLALLAPTPWLDQTLVGAMPLALVALFAATVRDVACERRAEADGPAASLPLGAGAETAGAIAM